MNSWKKGVTARLEKTYFIIYEVKSSLNTQQKAGKNIHDGECL